MGNGYLGKISAIVTANTADFQAKLDNSASTVRKFSREVQSNITKAMGDAEKSIQSIYTPLQRLEGSLKAAGSLKLSFKGFAGAIKDVEDLKSRLGSLNAQQVKIVLDQSGLSSLKDVRSALREFSNRDIRIFDAAGSLQDLQKIQAGLNTARGQRKLAKLGIDESELDALIQKFRRFPPQKIQAVVDVLGKDMLDSSFSRARQLFSLTEQINKPLMAAVDSFGALSREVQAGFNPALGKAQNKAQALADDIKNACTIGAGRFQKVEESVQRVTVAVKQLSEAASLVASLKTGRELAFDQPGLNAALTRGVKFGNDAQSQMAVSGVARANSGDVSTALQRIMAESKRAEAILAELKSAEELGLSGHAANLRKDLADVAAEINKVIDAGETKIDLQVKTGTAKVAVDQLAESLRSLRELADFTITGDFQNSQQTVSAIQEIIGMMDKLNAAQRTAVQPQINSLIDAARPDATTGLVDLVKFKAAYDSLKADVEKGAKLNLKTAEADANLKALRARIREIGEKANFVVNGTIQNPGQVEAEINRIVGSLGKLNAAGKAAVLPKVGDALQSLRAVDASGSPDINAMRAAYKALQAEFDKQLDIKVNADAAKSEVDKLRAALGSIADLIGEPAAPIDRLRKAVDEANAAINRLDASDPLRGKLEGDLTQLKGQLQAGSTPGLMPMSPGQIDASAKQAARIAAAANAGKPATTAKTPNDFGPDFGTSERQILSLRAKVVSLYGEMEKLPLPLQAQFIPAINNVKNAFQKINASSTTREIEVATKKATVLGTMLERAGRSAKLRVSLGDALDTAAFTRVETQIGFIRAKLLEVGAAASGPVATAFNNYSNFVADAAKKGTLGLAATKEQADQLAEKIAEAAVAAGNLTAAQGKQFTKGLGDVGRAGVDKYSLALNQAAFAVDDFLSSVGGWDQKLRAVSNNVTQLAFIVGGTTGLFVGLGAVLAGQAAVGIYKWINNGRTAEDQTKALNDALARQKSLVEELAEAFRSLGDAMTRGTFSAGGEAASEFTRQLDDIKKKQKEVRENNVADLDKNVQTERAEQVKLKSQLEKSTNPSERVVLQRRINASVEKEKEASSEAVDRKVNPDEARNRIREAMERVRLAELDPRGNDIGTFEEKIRQVRAQALKESQNVPVGNSAEDIKAQREALDKELQGLSQRSKNAGRVFLTDEGANAARDAAIPLERLLRSLDLPLLKAIDEAANKIAEASRGPAIKISQAQEDVADAIKRGVPSAGAFQRELDSSAKKLKSAYDRLEEAQKEATPEKRQEKVDEAQKNIAQVEQEMADLDARARELRLGRTFGGERATSALSGLSGERFANERTGATAKLMSAIDAEIQARKNLEAATAKGADAEIKAAEASLEAAQKASEAAAAFAEAIAALEVALSRVRRIGERAREKSESGAEAAQRAFEENPLQAGAREARDQAEAQLIQDNARIAEAQRQLDNKRQEIQASPAMMKITDEIEAKTQRRKDLEGKADIGGITPAEQNELDAARKREIELTRQRESLIRTLTDAERRQLDAINNGIAARERENEYNRQRSGSSGAIDRVTSGIGQIIESSRRQEDEAIQREIRAPSFDVEDVDRTIIARMNGRDDRQKAQEFQDKLEQKRKEIEGLPKVREERERIAETESQLADLSQKEAASGGLSQEDVTRRGSLQEIARKSRREIEYQLDHGTGGIQSEMMRYQKEIDNRDRANRGRILGMTERDRFKKEFAEGAGADINARAAELRGQGVDPTEFLKQSIKNQMKEVAPMLQGFEEERQTARIQGPSRAALQMSDVSTSQGASELTRLLRGDDSAKDVNLAELRKQTSKFDDLIEIIKQQNPGVLL